MPRAYPNSDTSNAAQDPGAGEWQALRGELVALLDKVESRYTPPDDVPAEPAMSGLSRRMQQLREQVDAPESSLRRREALRTVKRAVDRFSDRETSDADDDLTAAIAEIRSRQGAQPMRRSADMPEIRELSGLVSGISQRLERLEGDLRSQRSNAGGVREVASQVEQLTQVVELLAGAVGETGQVKRLEAQIAALATIVEEGPRTDLRAINARLDDVSATVGKLAELQAQQMEREISRDTRSSALVPEMAKVAPAVQSIEASVRAVYDRIDAIERSVALSAGDFERLTGDMAAITQTMKDSAGEPGALMARVDALAARLEEMDGGKAEIADLKTDIAGLRSAVLEGIEPRFIQIEGQIEALSERIVPVDTSAVESQLSALMARMDDAGAQLDGLAQLYASEEKPDFDALASMVAERTSEAVAKKAVPPVAMFGPDSLKSIEDRISGLIRSVGKAPDYEALADMVATRTSAALAKSAPPAAESDEGIDALEKRMTALLNTAGKDTAERLTRLEAMLAERAEAEKAAALAVAAPLAVAVAQPVAEVSAKVADGSEVPAETLRPSSPSAERLDAILANLSHRPADAMPANPAEDAPLIDRGPRPAATQRPAPQQKPGPGIAPIGGADEPVIPPFDPDSVQRPPRPQSSFGTPDAPSFAETPKPAAAPEPMAAPSNTSTFVAAARRAQRVKDEAKPAAGGSMIGRALARMRKPAAAKAASPEAPRTEVAEAATVAAAAAPSVGVAPVVEKPVREKRQPKVEAKAAKPAKAPKSKASKPAPADGQKPESFLTRHRRPLLLAATLTAVSLLALNLVLQRMSPADAVAPAVETAPATVVEPVDAPAVEPATDGDQSSVVPPRVIDLVDTTTTASINPGAPMSFSASNLPKPIEDEAVTLVPAGLGAAPATMADEAATFDLPAEAVGPVALREAAANGNARAQFEVAAILGEGRAVERDLEGAATWYERAAAQDFVPAQYRLGNLYELGSGVEQDFDKAQQWYRRSAEAGNRMAMHNLAALLAGGQLGEQQFEEAAIWFERAAALGVTDSQFNLGMLHARGLGVEQDFEQSFKWFSLAAANGDKDATQARDDIAKSLTAEAVSRVKSEIESWTVEPVDFAANFAPIGTWNDAFDPGAAIGSRDVVGKVQLALGRLGFDVGSADGVAGPKTAEAIRAFERATGMNESGAINPRLLAVLGSQPV